MVLIYEWGSPSCSPSIYKPELKQFTYSTFNMARWHDLPLNGAGVSSPPSGLPEEERSFFGALGVKSGVISPIFICDRFWGFIGFFDLDEWIRSPDEVEALRITANLLGAALGYR